MGAIEEERRRRSVKLENQKRDRILREQQDKERKERITSQIASQETRGKMLLQQAEQQLKESGLLKMVSELGGYESCSRYAMFRERDYQETIEKAGRIMYTMLIDSGRIGNMMEYKYFEMEIDAEGTIRFKASILASPTIGKNVWQRDRNKVETALVKAYKHPKVHRNPYEPDQSASKAR